MNAPAAAIRGRQPIQAPPAPSTASPAAPDLAALRQRQQAAWAEGMIVRRLGQDILPALEQHLLALGPEDRRMRFLTRFGDVAITAYARRIDPAAGVLVGAIGGRGSAIFGLAEAYPNRQPGRVEVAASVHLQHRGCGLGRHLVAQVAALSFAAGAEVAEFLFGPANCAVIRLIDSLGARFGPGLGRAEIRGAFALPAAVI